MFNNDAVNVEGGPFLPVASRPSGDFDDDGEVESADNGENFVYRELKCSIESKRELFDSQLSAAILVVRSAAPDKRAASGATELSR